MPLPTLENLSGALARETTTSRSLAEDCLARIQDPNGEGKRTFLRIDAAQVRLAADALDALRHAGSAPTRFAGIPISIKDLFDVRNEVTGAGSMAQADSAPAARDATVVERLRRAGFLMIGRTNMTEFAYSGLGLNPHFGTPANPWQREALHVPGGSSSGAAISVADGMAHAALGTDTGGSCRIPAAFTGIVGYKPTARLMPKAGIVPLSSSLDAAGSLARSVRCCASLHAIMAGEEDWSLTGLPLSGLRLAIPQTLALDALDDAIAHAFEWALAEIGRQGARLIDVGFECLDRIPQMNAAGGLLAMESYAWHRKLIASRKGMYDPRVLSRILKGADCSAADYIELVAARAVLINEAEATLGPYDAMIMPTAAILPPRIADLSADDAYTRANALAVRNTTAINMIDGCAISIPIHGPGDAPVGLMLASRGGDDHRLLAIAAAVEDALGNRDEPAGLGPS